MENPLGNSISHNVDLSRSLFVGGAMQNEHLLYNPAYNSQIKHKSCRTGNRAVFTFYALHPSALILGSH